MVTPTLTDNYQSGRRAGEEPLSSDLSLSQAPPTTPPFLHGNISTDVMDSGGDLPFPIEVEILHRLPAKSLRRVLCVCKSWYSVISNADFQATYLRNSISKGGGFILLKNQRNIGSTADPAITFSFCDKSFEERERFRVPVSMGDEFAPISVESVHQDWLPFDGSAAAPDARHNSGFLENGSSSYAMGGSLPDPSNLPLDYHENGYSIPYSNHQYSLNFIVPQLVDVVSSSINGLLCVLVNLGTLNGPIICSNLYIWNPSLGKSIRIPQSDSKSSALIRMVKFYVGFGHLEENGDYRIVRAACLGSKWEVETYSMNSNSWKLATNCRSRVLKDLIWGSSMSIFIHETCHWAVYARQNKHNFFILGFRFKKEKIRLYSLPDECVNGADLRYSSMFTYHGMLAISVLQFGEFESGMCHHKIWVMQEYGIAESWIHLVNIELGGIPRRPVGCCGSTGHLILLGDGEDNPVIYDPETTEIKSLDMFCIDAIVPCVESLALMNCKSREVWLDG